ncbi:MAG: molecular chaperone GrpE [Lysobacterales bacterium]
MTDKPETQNGQDETLEQPAQSEAVENIEAGENSQNGPENDSDNEFVELQLALGESERVEADYKEAMLRMQAEMENLRKRLIKDLERSRMRALESIMNDLLPVRDSLERGLETDDSTATVESMKEGKALIIKMLAKVMDDHGLKVIDPAEEVFNPELHQAMSMQESRDHEPNTVLVVLQKGFQLNDRLLRPAMVVVSK